MPGAGDLDRRITIQRYDSSATDDFNEPIGAWTDYTTVWAKRSDPPDRARAEVLQAGQIGSSLMSRFVVRSSSKTRTVTPVDRLSYDGAIWNIKNVKETSEGRRQFIEITAVRDLD